MNSAAQSTTIISTSGIEAPRRLDYWRDMISSTFVALDCDAPIRREFSGFLEVNALQDVRFSRVVSDAQHVVRSRQRIRQSTDEFFLISVQCGGRGIVTQEDRVAVLGVGDFVLYDATRPYELHFDDAFEQLVLRIPRHYLSRRIACPERLTAMAFHAARGSSAVVSDFMLQVYRRLDQLEPACVAPMHQVLVDLVVTGLSGGQSDELPTANRLLMHQRIKSFVELHLGESSLDCQRIAASFGISLRYLNKIFEDDELPLSEWIWSRRLEKARTALECSRATGQSITQIAYDWGFKDPAHFSRAFKARYGITPSLSRDGPRTAKHDQARD
jgi:AraC-like DNA-binding protein